MDLRAKAKQLRRHMTPAEHRLWEALRAKRLGLKFRRQAIVGPYIVDFLCVENRLNIEADGAQHCDSPADRARDAYLTARGYRVLRFWNTDVTTHLEGVLDEIVETAHR